MDFVLGPAGLQTPFSFSIPRFTPRGNEVKQVGVYCSGGHDSGVMLCLALAELKATGRLDSVRVTAFTIIKNEGSTFYAERIVKKVSEHFGVHILHMNNLPNGQSTYAAGRAGGPIIMDLWRQNYHDTIIYMSINRMAPDDIRPFKQTLKIFYEDETKWRAFKSPFLLLHKPQIADLYYQLGCEDIIPWTHSCTVLAQGQCEECYSCKEREWGLTALGKERVDTIPPDIEDVSYGGTWVNPAFPAPPVSILQDKI
jgi:hypothetical protein